jgi:hypothetical protein
MGYYIMLLIFDYFFLQNSIKNVFTLWHNLGYNKMSPQYINNYGTLGVGFGVCNIDVPG